MDWTRLLWRLVRPFDCWRLFPLLAALVLLWLGLPELDAHARQGTKMNAHPYEVRLVREGGTKAGALATMNVQVVAPTSEMAKKTAEAQWPGYRAINAQRSE